MVIKLVAKIINESAKKIPLLKAGFIFKKG
jgi:hypothetical protein